MEKGTEEGNEGLITVKIWLGKEEWRLVGIYVKKDLEKKIEEKKGKEKSINRR